MQNKINKVSGRLARVRDKSFISEVNTTHYQKTRILKMADREELYYNGENFGIALETNHCFLSDYSSRDASRARPEFREPWFGF